MASTYLEDAVFRLRPQAIVVSITSYEARAAGLCERYAKVNSRNRTCHSLIEVFDRLYEASVPEYCAARLREIMALGVTRIYIGTRAVGVDLAERNADRIGREVLPLLR